MLARFGESNADIVLVGHIRYPQDRQLEEGRVVNVGSISNPVMTIGDTKLLSGVLGMTCRQ